MKSHQKKEGNIIRQFYEPPNEEANEEEQHHSRHVVVRKTMPAGLHTREPNSKFVWGSFKDDNNNDILALGFEPAEEEKRFITPTRKIGRTVSRQASNLRSAAVAPLGVVEGKVVQILATGAWIIKLVAPDVCEAILVNRLEDTEKVPKKIFNTQITQIGRSLRAIYELKNYFERNGLVVDKEVRDVFVANIPKAVATSQVSDIVAELSSVNFIEEMWRPLPKDSNALVKLSKIHTEGESNAWGKAETIIDASAEEVRANK